MINDEYFNCGQCEIPPTNENEMSLAEQRQIIWDIMDQWKLELFSLNNEDWSPASFSWSSRSQEENRLTVIDAVEKTIHDQMQRSFIASDVNAVDNTPTFTYPAYKNWQNIEYILCVGLVPIRSDEIILTSTSAATSKGLVAGNLSYINEDGIEVDCRMATGGETIPSNIEGLYSIRTDAKIILVVEKDAVFQTLLQDSNLKMHRIILITAKGIPDLNTRQLLYRLWKSTGIPIFALVDADPFGIEIMCVYRFGSLTTTWCAESLAVPSVRWLGLHPSDFPYLNSSQMKVFSKHDEIKCKAILNRPYIEHWPNLKKELEIISLWQEKAEIENLASSAEYILNKITEKQWV